MSARTCTAVAFLTILFACYHVTFVDAVEGRLFFLAYMNLSTSARDPANGIQEIFISCIKESGKVRIEYKPWNRTEIIRLNSTNKFQYTVTIYPDLAGPLGTKLPASIIISAEMDISVQTNKAEDGTGGGYLALPITSNSLDFYIASYTPRQRTSMFSIAAPFDTCVDVQYYDGPNHYRIMYLSLPPGTVYHAGSVTQDFTGIRITSSKPIAVYGGLDCAFVPADASPQVQSCDHIIEQIPPSNQLGKEFIMSSFYGRNPSAGFQYRVIAAEGCDVREATIAFDPTTSAAEAPVDTGKVFVKKGQYYEGSVGRGNSKPMVAIVTCSTDCLVMQYNQANDITKTGAEPGNSKPDEFMITVPSLDHYTKDITFSTSKYYISNGNTSADFVNGITVIVKKSNLGAVMLDGATPVASIPGAKVFSVVPSPALASTQLTEHAVVQASVTPGFHTVTSAGNAEFMVYVYGAAPSTSSGNTGYGYLAGYKYITEADALVTNGPYFDFTDPITAVTVPPQTGTKDPSAPLVTSADYPNYEAIFEIKFYTLVPATADLKTRNCSEAYYRYYIEQRFQPMRDKLTKMFIPQQCSPAIAMNMTHLLYYSEYTDGKIRFSIKMIATDKTATLNDIFDCIGFVSDYVTQLTNWVPNNGYNDVTDFLKNDIFYVQGCDILHMNSSNFDSFYFGWNCPTRGGLIGISGGNYIAASVATILGLLWAQLVLSYTR